MSALGERDEFDFSEEILGEPTSNELTYNPVDKPKEVNNKNNEALTSYLLVNALLSLLIKKGIIYQHEVNALVGELHREYVKKKGPQK